MLQTGDIGAIKATAQQQAFNNLISPVSFCWHHFLVGPGTADGDFEIAESIGKGVSPGRLSFYKGMDVSFYRYPDATIAELAWQQVSKYGRCDYDYILYPQLLAVGFSFWVRNGFKPIPYYQFRIPENQKLICTALVCDCFFGAGGPLVSPSVNGTPSAIRQSFLDGRIYIPE